MAEIVTTALGLIGKMAATPLKDAAMRRPGIISALKKLHLDPKQPPQDFYSLYAYALVETFYGRPVSSLLNLFKDEYVQQSFYRSFSDDDWTRLAREVAEAIERNRETKEFGHLGHGVDEELRSFISKFHDLVSRSRTAYEVRVENKIDDVSRMLDQVLKTRYEEEARRQFENPERAESSPAERLKSDVQTWFAAVGYKVRSEWRALPSAVALLVEVPQRRRGRFDLVVVMCVDGELAPYQMETLKTLVADSNAAEGWGIAHLRVSEAARRRARESEDVLFCYSFDELIDLEADFEPYIDWLENEVRGRQIDTRYVPLSCQKEEVDPLTETPSETSVYEWRDGGLDRYVDTWLSDPAKKHLSILGEFGMGKSWFAMHLAGRLAQGWKDAKLRGVARPRIPLVIPLRDYAKQTSVSALLSEFFFHKHNVALKNYDVFRVLNRMGRFLLIFDGFDEMASRTDRNTMVSNFWELASVAEPGAKVLLSSRTEYFPEAKQARDIFAARVSTAATTVPADGPTFEIVELIPFDDDQIRLMLGHLLTPAKLQVVMDHDDVRDLMRRPVMSELVIDALPEIEQGAVINLARIYLYAIKRKMDRDVLSERTFTSRTDKVFFLCEVAWEMIRSSQLRLNYRDFPEKLRACFGSVVENAKDLDYWEQDMRNQGMLVRNSRGDYGPSHKSLLEFLVAFKFAAELGLLRGDFLRLVPVVEGTQSRSYSWSRYFSSRAADGTLPEIERFQREDGDRLADNFGSAEYNPVIFDFLATMVKECDHFQSDLIEIIRGTAELAKPQNLGGNCGNLIGQAGGSLAGAELDGANLSGLCQTGELLLDVSLEGASMAGADLTGARLALLNKQRVNFKGAHLRGSDFLISKVVPERILFHADGAFTALRAEQSSVRRWQQRFNHNALHWPSGDVNSEAISVPLRRKDPDPWGEGCGIFKWEEGTWGYSDYLGASIASSTSGQVLYQIPGRVYSSILWGGIRALVMSDEDEGNRLGIGWVIVDPRSGEQLAVCDEEDAHREQFELFSYDTGESLLSLWASGDHETAIFEMRAGSAKFSEVSRIPVGVKDSINRRQSPHVMADGENFYLRHSELGCLTYPKDVVGEAAGHAGEAGEVQFTPDAGHLVFSFDNRLEVWECAPERWRMLWSAPTSTAPVGQSVVSSDGTRLASACSSGEVSIRSLLSGEILASVSFNPHLRQASFSRDGDLDLDGCDGDSIILAGGVII
ncbi:NACHT domain-containing protein [Streptomyces sp. NPDC002144]